MQVFPILNSEQRICFQIELAHWFYEDYYRELNPRLPGYFFLLHEGVRILIGDCAGLIFEISPSKISISSRNFLL